MESGENKKKSSSSNYFTSSFVAAKNKCINSYSNQKSRKDGYEKFHETPSAKYLNKSTQTEPEERPIQKQKDLIQF